MRIFNLRVYAIIINSNNEVLIADEHRFGRAFTKFPGGGLKWGEGLKEAIARELEEELHVTAEIGNLFYVNDFFQKSSFSEADQIFSFYYHISSIDFDAIQVSNHEFPLTEDGEKFRWIPFNELSEDVFSFPIDKLVYRKLIERKF